MFPLRCFGSIATLVAIFACSAFCDEPNSKPMPDVYYTIMIDTPSGLAFLGRAGDRIVFTNFEPKPRKEQIDLPTGPPANPSFTWDLVETESGSAFKLREEGAAAHGYLTYDKARPEKGLYLSERLEDGSIWRFDQDKRINTELSNGDLHLGVGPEPKAYLTSYDTLFGIERVYAPTMSNEITKLRIARGTPLVPQPSVVVFRAGGALFGRADGEVGLIESKMVPDGNVGALPERKAKLSTMWTSQPTRGGAYLKSRGQYLSFDPAAPEDGLRMVEKEGDAVVWTGTRPPGRGTSPTRIVAEIKGKKWGIASSEGIDRFFMQPGSIISIRLPNISDDPKEWMTFECEEGSR